VSGDSTAIQHSSLDDHQKRLEELEQRIADAEPDRQQPAEEDSTGEPE